MKVSSKIYIIDKGWNKVIKDAKRLRDAYVTVGIHSDRVYKENGVSVAQVAAYHEFGVDVGNRRIPQRSFIRSTLEYRKKQIINYIANEYKASMISKTVRQALGSIGFFVQSMLVRTIKSSGSYANEKWEPLSFIKKNWPRERWPKSTSLPLIKTHQLLESISFQIHGA